ncbi:MAG: hypothetical protein KTR24_06250 [Saprospiraceae bacterium]|nr:hypothetical protein [Saprospiraceae bacterium]
MNKKELLTIVGFALFIIGFTAITLSLVGLRWSWLSWIDDINPLFGFLTKIAMAVGGITLVAYLRMGSGIPEEKEIKGETP